MSCVSLTPGIPLFTVKTSGVSFDTVYLPSSGEPNGLG